MRGIQAGEGRLLAEATGEMELDGTVLVLRRIHVHYRLKAGPDAREAAERVLGVHVNRCPVARSIGSSIAISASLTLEEGWDRDVEWYLLSRLPGESLGYGSVLAIEQEEEDNRRLRIGRPPRQGRMQAGPASPREAGKPQDEAD